MKPSFWNSLAACLASGFYLSHPLYRFSTGRFKIGLGCGLVGSFWALLFRLLLPPLSKPITLVLLMAISLISIVIATAAEAVYAKKDDPRIVIDEFAGYLWAAAWLPKTWTVMIAAFAVFRIFDVWKPLGIRRLEKLPKGWGCVADDVASGIAAGALIQLTLTTLA
ncbi:MAG: phosphatidylglycerophosphatase A [Elusimicrobia bacterium]|nr:phosphatidylglycerophosphatase A [Elusimicrobiota bacterium]